MVYKKNRKFRNSIFQEKKNQGSESESNADADADADVGAGLGRLKSRVGADADASTKNFSVMPMPLRNFSSKLFRIGFGHRASASAKIFQLRTHEKNSNHTVSLDPMKHISGQGTSH